MIRQARTRMAAPEARRAEESRREFFRGLARWASSLAIAAAGWLVLAPRGRAARRETCTGAGICSRCGSLEGCGLPQALSLKAARSTR